MKKKKIVTIGGGTGSFTLLSGLKKYPVEIAAIVSMADDGGSTGQLRDELGVLPPGDVRQCLVALSESSEKMRELMNYRFEEGSLKGHSFGNLLLSALEKMNGSFTKGVDEAMKILRVRGEVIPVTTEDIALRMVLKDGTVLDGEDAIGAHRAFQNIGIESFGYRSKVGANPQATKRILQADVVVIGPGDHYTSILPNLLIKEIAQALKKTKATVIYVCNLTNKRGHTAGWSVEDYVASLEKYIGPKALDYILMNTKKPLPHLVEKYEREEGKNSLVELRGRKLLEGRYEIVKGNFVSSKKLAVNLSDAIALTRSFIRHDSAKLARAIMFLLDLDENRRLFRIFRRGAHLRKRNVGSVLGDIIEN
jgi:uncharacterized cofD-like protein